MDFNLNLEFTGGYAAGPPIQDNNLEMLADVLLPFFGKYVKGGVAPNITRTFTIQNPPVQDASEQADSGTDFYGRTWSIVHAVKAIRQFAVQDAVPTEIALIMEGGQPFRVEIAGQGAAMTEGAVGTPAFVDFARPVLTWQDALDDGANSFIKVANSITPTDKVEARRVVIRFNPNLRIEPQVGIPATAQYKKPYRNGPPSIRVEFDIDFDYGRTGFFDGGDAIAAFVNSTKEGVDILWGDGTNAKIAFGAKGQTVPANNPGLVEDCVLTPGGDGVMSVAFAINILPVAIGTDVTFVITSSK